MQSPSTKYLYGKTNTFGTPLKATKAEEDAIMAQLDPGPRRKGGKKAPSRLLLTHEERRVIIEAPMPAICFLGRTRTWGGMRVGHNIPQRGQRVRPYMPDDDQTSTRERE